MEAARTRMLALRKWKEEEAKKQHDAVMKAREEAEAKAKAEAEALKEQAKRELERREAAAKAKEEKKEADKKAKLELEKTLAEEAEKVREEKRLADALIVKEAVAHKKTLPARPIPSTKGRGASSASGVVERASKTPKE